MSSQEEEAYERAQQREFERSIHQQNVGAGMQAPEDEGTAEILRYLSDVDDLPISQDDPIMGQLISKITSTANLSAEEVKSNKWVREYILILYLCKYPDTEGMHSDNRAWAHDDINAYRQPLTPEKRAELEAFVTTSNLALSRSEDGFATKESTRTVSESIVNDNKDDGGGGGILGRLGR